MKIWSLNSLLLYKNMKALQRSKLILVGISNWRLPVWLISLLNQSRQGTRFRLSWIKKLLRLNRLRMILLLLLFLRRIHLIMRSITWRISFFRRGLRFNSWVNRFVMRLWRNRDGLIEIKRKLQRLRGCRWLFKGSLIVLIARIKSFKIV